MSLVAAVAVAATSFVLVRQKEQKPTADEEEVRPDEERPAEFSLDALRAAGL